MMFFKKKNMLLISLFCALLLCGCAEKAPIDSAAPFETEAVETAEKYSDLLGECFDISAVLERLQSEGCTAVDISNDYGVVNADGVRSIFPIVSALPDGHLLTIYRICLDGGLIGNFFYVQSGQLRCAQIRISWVNCCPAVTYSLDYAVTDFKLTDKEYLIFTVDIPDNTALCSHDGYIEPTTMIRLATAEAKCVEYREKYLSAIGYNSNNLFTVDWTKDDMSSVDLNNLFLALYKVENGMYISYYNNPYLTDEATGLSTVPKEDFEALISKYTYLVSAEIMRLAGYDEEIGGYLINISGPHDGLAKIPVPEVTAYTDEGDGTIRLYVDALFAQYATDKAFSHVVTIKTDANGTYKYAANDFEESADNILPTA